MRLGACMRQPKLTRGAALRSGVAIKVGRAD
jgi:hypothetical protein